MMSKESPSSIKSVATMIAAVAALIGIIVTAVKAANAFNKLEHDVLVLQKKHDPGDLSEQHPIFEDREQPASRDPVGDDTVKSQLDELRRQHDPDDHKAKHPGLGIFARSDRVQRIERKLENLERTIPATPNLAALVAPPIGSIIAWHKDLRDVPTKLPDGWVECNGPSPRDPDSKIDMTRIPNLNDPNERNFLGNEFGGAFLRGGVESGDPQGDAFQGHGHTLSYQNSAVDGGPGGVPHGPGPGIRIVSDVVREVTDIGWGQPRTDSETRPVNMSVVWIIRVK